MSLEKKGMLFNLLFGCPKADFDLDMLNKIKTTSNDTSATNVATNARVVFKLLLIINVNYHVNLLSFKNMIHIQI